LKQTPDRWVYRVGWPFRLVNLGAALGLVVAGLLVDGGWLAYALAVLALVGGLYEESIDLDKGKNRAELRVGLVFWHRRRTYRLDQVVEVRCSAFGEAKFVVFELGLDDGRVMTIENDRGKTAGGRLTAWAGDLAAWLGLPLTTG